MGKGENSNSQFKGVPVDCFLEDNDRSKLFQCADLKKVSN